ncbi:ArsR family transcriptional regulator [Acrocarpospora corrugata]|uniref:ArsR family transcriptional regulator n=1 Tax=Acrocarpospora corrugata TaxID=35763 RepID=A0A5M3W852_9ACTN|nr:ArsR family transcriptional regulator [Acrocarpospora corrugata]
MLLPLVRTAFQGELLAWLYLHPEDEYPLVVLAQQFRVSPASVTREVDRLSAAGLIKVRRVGNLRLVSADEETIIARPLTELLALTYGPIVVLPELLSGVPGVEEAYIYGSWAARYEGEPGRVPRDVDVLVVGEPGEDDLYLVARRAEQQLGREVNLRRMSRGTWESTDEDPFLESLRSRPLVGLEIEGTGVA